MTSTGCSHRGLSLIEVVAGLALMGTLVAAMLSARGRFAEQHRHALRVLAATEALDGLLAERYAVITGAERSISGRFDHTETLRWRATAARNPDAELWHCRVVRVEVFDTSDAIPLHPLVSVELLVQDPSKSLPAETEPVGNNPPGATGTDPVNDPTQNKPPATKPPLEPGKLTLGHEQ